MTNLLLRIFVVISHKTSTHAIDKALAHFCIPPYGQTSIENRINLILSPKPVGRSMNTSLPL